MTNLLRYLHSEPKDELCSICRSLAPQSLAFSDELLGSTNEDLVLLGTLEEVLARQSCPLCRLVLHLVYDGVATYQSREGGLGSHRNLNTFSWCAIRRSGNVLDVIDHFGLQGYICNAGRTALPDPALDDLEYVGSAFGRQLKIPLVRSWIRTCEKQHHLCTTLESTLDKVPLKFTLIDIHNNCLVEATSEQRYFALSYVWGEVQLLRTTKANRDELHGVGSLLKRRGEIPQAIQDAMTLVSLLNERFLWVDSLCIVQDDEINKHEQVQSMNVVYGQAFLTIIAMSGKDANCPLPGVTFHSRPELFAVADIGYNRLISRPLKMNYQLQSSPYESRAWTYQERLLSRRCLILTTHQAYYHCPSSLQSDISNSGNPDDPDTSSLNPLSAILEQRLRINRLFGSQVQSVSFALCSLGRTEFLLYNDLVRAYSVRILSFPSDKLSAFAGIEAVLKGSFNCDFIYGLPENALDTALLWISEQKNQGTATTQVESRIRGFPSWSWAGHLGPVRYFKGPLQCLTRDECGPLIPKVSDFTVTINSSSRVLQRWNNGPQVDSDSGDSRMESTTPSIPFLRTVSITASASSLQNGTLSFRASCTSLVNFSVEGAEWDPSIIIIYDPDRNCCGRIWPDWSNTLANLDSQDFLNFPPNSGHLVLVSKSDAMDEKNAVQLGYHFDVDKFPITACCMVNTLLVRTRDGAMERIGVAQLHAKAWESAERMDKGFDLQ